MKKISKVIVYYQDGTFEELVSNTNPTPKTDWYPPSSPVYGPIVNPNPWAPQTPLNPNVITCKMADGSTHEIKLDGPITAYATNQT
jgi:hypothetical protein